MYKVRLSTDEKERIANGNVVLLLTKLVELDKSITKDLKKHKGDDIAYLQGISYIVDELISILNKDA